MNKTQLKRFNAQLKAKKEEIPTLEVGAKNAGSCWENEKLGYAKGYADALEEVLKTIKPKNPTPKWVLAVEKLKKG
jgi:hypothetical protein